MADVTLSFGKTTVKQIARYRIEEDGPGRLVLRARKLTYYAGGAVLAFIGGVFLFVAVVLLGREGLGMRATMGGLGALAVWGAVALVRAGLNNRDRIVFDTQAGVVRFDMTRAQDRSSLPFTALERVELRRVDRSSAGEARILYPVVLVQRDGGEVMLDEASDAGQMTELALKAAHLCGVKLEETVSKS